MEMKRTSTKASVRNVYQMRPIRRTQNRKPRKMVTIGPICSIGLPCTPKATISLPPGVGRDEGNNLTKTDHNSGTAKLT
jgi:hypothetical protein